MPSNLMFADASFPHIGEDEEPKQAIRKIENYLFMLLEQLRYTLQNLDFDTNFNANELEGYFKKLLADLIVADTIISNTVITNELYAEYGAIADLTVDKLRTDYKRARRYLEGDTSQLDYISIHDEEISFISATTDGTQSQQMEVYGRKFWWRDESKSQMTGEKDTGLPVMVYVYQELTKAQFKFKPLPLEDGSSTVMPVLTFGAGVGQGDGGTASIVKHGEGLDISYKTRDGRSTAGVYLRDDGFVDWRGRRADIQVDTAAKKFTITPEGALGSVYEITYEETDGGVRLTWPDGGRFTVEVV